MSQHDFTELASVANPRTWADGPLSEHAAPVSTVNPSAPDLDETAVVAEPLASQLNALLVKAAVTNRNKTRAAESARVATAEVVATFGLKATQQATDPLGSGRVISQVTVSKPSYKATFTDRQQAEKWVRAQYPEKVEKATRVVPGQEQAALLALQAHAAYLLEEHEYVPDYVLDRLLLKSEQAYEPMGLGGEVGADGPPGIQVDPRPAGVTITYRDADLIDDLIMRGVIDDEGNILVQPAAPAAFVAVPEQADRNTVSTAIAPAEFIAVGGA